MLTSTRKRVGVRFLLEEVDGILGVGTRRPHRDFGGCWDKGSQDTRCKEEWGHSDLHHFVHDREFWASNTQFHEMGKASDPFDDTSEEKNIFSFKNI